MSTKLKVFCVICTIWCFACMTLVLMTHSSESGPSEAVDVQVDRAFWAVEEQQGRAARQGRLDRLELDHMRRMQKIKDDAVKEQLYRMLEEAYNEQQGIY